MNENIAGNFIESGAFPNVTLTNLKTGTALEHGERPELPAFVVITVTWRPRQWGRLHIDTFRSLFTVRRKNENLQLNKFNIHKQRHDCCNDH